MIIEIKVDGKTVFGPGEVTTYCYGVKTPRARIAVIHEGDKKIIRSLGRMIIQSAAAPQQPTAADAAEGS